jgi:DNA-binding FadR family transcriptional regulator
MTELVERPVVASTRLRVPKTAEVVADHLRRQIVRGELREGESLPSELTLTERYGVSRPTLREAFRVLEAEQLITVRRGSRGGATVHEPSAAMVARYAGFVLEHARSTLVEVCEARVQIEAPCARLAAERRTPDDVAALREAVSHCELVGHDHERFTIESSAFHALLVDIAGNRTLSLLHSMIRTIIDMAKFRRFAEAVEASARTKAVTYGSSAHILVVDLIESGDGERAEALWRRHLEASNRFLLELHGSSQPLDLSD